MIRCLARCNNKYVRTWRKFIDTYMHIRTLIITTSKLCTLCTQWRTMDGSGWCLPFHHLPSLYVGEFHLISIWLMGSQGTVVTPYPHPSPVLMQQSSEQEVYKRWATWPRDALSTWLWTATDHYWNGVKNERWPAGSFSWLSLPHLQADFSFGVFTLGWFWKYRQDKPTRLISVHGW